jgi:hypothetical protein
VVIKASILSYFNVDYLDIIPWFVVLVSFLVFDGVNDIHPCSGTAKDGMLPI